MWEDTIHLGFFSVFFWAEALRTAAPQRPSPVPSCPKAWMPGQHLEMEGLVFVPDSWVTGRSALGGVVVQFLHL